VFESKLHGAIRRMIARNIHVSKPFVTSEGTMVLSVNGYLLTAKQILELSAKNQLTSWGIRDCANRSEAR